MLPLSEIASLPPPVTEGSCSPAKALCLTSRKLQLGKINLLLRRADIFGGGIPNIQDISAVLFNSEFMFL